MPADTSVDAFIAAIADERVREDAGALSALLAELTSEPPTLWGKIIGFGRYRYRYDSGREGEAMRIGFAPRKAENVLYLASDYERPDLLARLGVVKSGKSCLYIKRFAALDQAVLADLIRANLAEIERRDVSSLA